MQDSMFGAPYRPGRTVALDPLAEAGRLLRQAARVPYSAARPHTWAAAFRKNAVGARAALGRHVRRMQKADAPLLRLQREEPRLALQITRATEAHEELLGQTRKLVQEAEQLTAPGIWDIVEMGEKAMLLAQEIERHQGRELEIVHEGHMQDLGGG